MSESKQMLNEEQIDFLKEMMNIGAGNACTALQKILQHPVELIIPRIHLLSATRVSSIFDSPSLLSCADPLVLSRYVDGILLVLEEERTTADDLKKVMELLKDKPVFGTLLNKSKIE